MTRHTLAAVTATVVMGWLLAIWLLVVGGLVADAVTDEIRRGRA